MRQILLDLAFVGLSVFLPKNTKLEKINYLITMSLFITIFIIDTGRIYG